MLTARYEVISQMNVFYSIANYEHAALYFKTIVCAFSINQIIAYFFTLFMMPGFVFYTFLQLLFMLFYPYSVCNCAYFIITYFKSQKFI